MGNFLTLVLRLQVIGF